MSELKSWRIALIFTAENSGWWPTRYNDGRAAHVDANALASNVPSVRSAVVYRFEFPDDEGKITAIFSKDADTE